MNQFIVKKHTHHRRELSDQQIIHNLHKSQSFGHQFITKQRLIQQMNRKTSEMRKTNNKMMGKIIQDSEQYEYFTNSISQKQLIAELNSLRKLVYDCQNCKNKIHQMKTVKPTQIKCDNYVQTQNDLHLFLRLEQKLNELEKQSRKNIKAIQIKDEIIANMDQQILQIDEKIKNGIFFISQDIFHYQQILEELPYIKSQLLADKQIPSYLKGICLEQQVKFKLMEQQRK